MICPQCGTGIKLDISSSSAVYPQEHEEHKQYGYDIAHGFCPQCGHLIILRRYGKYWQHNYSDEGSRELYPDTEEVLFPPPRRSKPVEPEVPEHYKTIFLEAVAVLDLSPKASAAISRRLLQDILHNRFGLKAATLAAEIDLFLKLSEVPTVLIGQIDAIRNIGNFAAHPLKDSNTGEIIDVEPGEAEWLIGTLEALFDFAFVQPKRLEEMKNKLNIKLSGAGKPPMK